MECETCKVRIEEEYGSGRFCGQKCARAFSTLLKRKEINEKVSKKLSAGKEFICESCNNSFDTRAGLNLHKKNHLRKFEDLKKDVTRKVWLLKERGHACEICKLEAWMGRMIPIELDHIDGNPGNNSRENLRLICPNCHAQTFHYRGRNVGHHTGTIRQKSMAKYQNYRKKIEEL